MHCYFKQQLRSNFVTRATVFLINLQRIIPGVNLFVTKKNSISVPVHHIAI